MLVIEIDDGRHYQIKHQQHSLVTKEKIKILAGELQDAHDKELTTHRFEARVIKQLVQ